MTTQRSNFIQSICFGLLFLLFSSLAYGQKTDTLTFFSKAFNQERTVYIKTPRFYKYQSDLLKLPVIYMLDGQHEWFLDPALSSIKYLQYTHEIPQAIIVVIPHKSRNKECGIVSLDQAEAPLHTFITKEINEKLKPYNPGDYRVLVGHSFSASFAMYSYMLAPDFYSAIIANSPLDQLENLIKTLLQNKNIDKSRIYLSFGAVDKDSYHRKAYEDMKIKYPTFFSQAHTFLANSSGHTAMPIVAIPELLNEVFAPFYHRYRPVAKVDEFYKLVTPPKSVADELAQIAENSTLGGHPYPPELPDINGIASRYNQSGYKQQAIGVYELGLKYYPNFYGFNYELAQLYINTDIKKAKMHLDKALNLLQTIQEKDGMETITEMRNFQIKNGL
jgi:predicted alpha/beta superfamily hydrolase